MVPAEKPVALDFLKAQVRSFRREMPRISGCPDGKPVHRLRVTTRRVRALLWLLDHGSAPRRDLPLADDLRKLGHALGEVRELDVAIADADRRNLDTSALIALRKNRQRKLLKLLTPRHQKRWVRELSELETPLRRAGPIAIRKANAEMVSLLARCTRTANARVPRPRQLHRIRIAMKKSCYLLEAEGRPVAPIKPLLKILGRAHDLEKLRTFTKRTPQRKLKKKQRLLSQQSVGLMRPTLQYAIQQLKVAGL